MVNTIFIMLICVLVIDHTDFIDHIKSTLSRLLTKGNINSSDYHLKPFDCSLCMTFWLNLIYIIATKNFTLGNTVLILTLAVLTPVVASLISIIFNILNRTLRDIDDYFNN